MSGQEIELKFRLSADQVERLRAHAAFAAAKAKDLTTVYFDSPDLALRRAGFNLRVRKSGGGYVQTVKRLSGKGLFDRDEWEGPVAGPDLDLLRLAETPAALSVEYKAMGPVFTLRIHRLAVDITAEGARVEAALDVGVAETQGCRQAVCELELELKDGDPAALFALARALAWDAPLSFIGKSERGYRVLAGQALGALRADRVDIKARATAAEAFRHSVLSALRQVAGNGEVVTETNDLEAVHQMRVGLRRLRAAMTAFAPMVQDEAFERLKAEVKWLAGGLDAARDIDVFRQTTFAATPVGAKGRAAFLKRLIAAEADALVVAREAMASPAYARLLLDAAEWAEIGAWTRDPVRQAHARRRADAFAAETLEKLFRKVLKRGRKLAALSPEKRHRLRLRIKALRYAAEFFAGAFPRRGHKRFAAALKGLQDALGELNDLHVGNELAVAIAGPDKSAQAFAQGLEAARPHAKASALLKRALKAYDGLIKAGVFWD